MKLLVNRRGQKVLCASPEDLAPLFAAGRLAFVPGRAFFADGSNGNTLRLSFSCADEAMIAEGIARLGRLLRQG